MIAAERFGPIGVLLAYGIAGHHAGLANGAEGGERTGLRDRMRGTGLPPLKDDWRREIVLPERLSLPKLMPHMERGMFQLAFRPCRNREILYIPGRHRTDFPIITRDAQNLSAYLARAPAVCQGLPYEHTVQETLGGGLAGASQGGAVMLMRMRILRPLLSLKERSSGSVPAFQVHERSGLAQPLGQCSRAKSSGRRRRQLG